MDLLLIDDTLCIKVAYYRQKLLLTREGLAAITGLRPKHIGDIERGKKVRIHTLARLAAGLGVSIDKLVNGK